jgi:hypothetical protein
LNGRRIAQVLWVAWAVVVWNVVFDLIVVRAGRAYINAAIAVRGNGPYPRADDWMGAAVTSGFWIATAAASAILLVGFVAIRAASRRNDS